MNRIRSTRRLEIECTRNIEVMWLMEKLTPDHNTIARFRQDNDKPLRKVFRVFVRICVELELAKGQRICIDGSPIKAVNGMHRATSMEVSKKKLQYYREQEIRQMEEAGETQILYTDPEARVMPAKQNGKKACYNVQTATDADSHMDERNRSRRGLYP